MSVLEQEQLERLNKAMQKIGEETKEYHIMRVRKKIERYIEDLEDIAIAQERLADIRSGKSKTIPYEEIKEELLR